MAVIRSSVRVFGFSCYLFFLAMLSYAPVLQAAPCTASNMNKTIPAIALKKISDGLKQPVHITHAGDGSERLYVVEQAGRIRVLKNGKLLATPFLDIRNNVESGGEKGLLSVAFHPDYVRNGWFYVYYTTSERGLYSIIARYQRGANGMADTASEQRLLRIKQPYSNHNGGLLKFGPDGYLYIGLGDGGSANDPRGHGQNRATLLGSMLRIDINRKQNNMPYAIPSDNPWRATSGVRPEIWAYGLRNPWRFSFDALSGVLYAADVGQNLVEEIDIIQKGGNYGWNIMEGELCTPGVNPRCNKRGLLPPIFTYRHPEGFSITGGYVYRGQTMSALCGVYVYADYVTQKLWGLRYNGNKVTAQGELMPKSGIAVSSFGEDQTLELYAVDHSGGAIYQLIQAAR